MNKGALRLEGVALAGGVLLLAVLLLLPFTSRVLSVSFYDNTSIESRVNVTNLAPDVMQVILHSEDDGPGSAITLYEGTTTHIICNATVQEYNGYEDIDVSSINATAWIQPLVGYTAADDNNNHYTNQSGCTVTKVNMTAAWVACSFQFQYYANNDTRWVCNMTVFDNEPASDSNVSEATTVAALFALNLTTHNESMMLDFGNMAPGDTTSDANEQFVNITNTGNIGLSIAIEGYGETVDDGMAMNCTIGNISADNLRYNISDDSAFAGMYNLTVYSDPNTIPDFIVPQRVDDDDAQMFNSTNTTWWKLSVPYGTKGFCNGTVVFSAVG